MVHRLGNEHLRSSLPKPDFYTVKLDDGSRSLVIEDSFSVIEDRFARLRSNSLKDFAKLGDEDRALLCVFTAMMSTRTKSQRANWTDFFSKLHDQVESMEKFHNAEPTTSLETAEMKEYGHHMYMGHSIDFIARRLFRMNMVIFTAGQKERFITSDRSCVWFNPEAHSFRPSIEVRAWRKRELRLRSRFRRTTSPSFHGLVRMKR
jgi:Protein of unknown function (DUF4238)